MNTTVKMKNDLLEWLEDDSKNTNVNKSKYIEYVVELYNSSNNINVDIATINFEKDVTCKDFHIANKESYKVFKNKCQQNNLNNYIVINYLLYNYVKDKNIILPSKSENDNFKKKKSNVKMIYVNAPKEILNYKITNEEKDMINQKIQIFNPSLINYFYNINDFYEAFYSIYKMLFIFKYTTGEIAECFTNRAKRTVESWIKKLNWELDRFEAQQRIVARGRRDYKQIMNKGKETRMKNYYSVDGDNPEEYTRNKLNYYLPQYILNCQIIVGLNNTSILDGGNEVDIPILIFKDNKIYKFAVEYNGDYWHSDEKRDIIKQETVESKNYHLFFISQKPKSTPKQIMEHIDDEIIKIKDKILSIINS